MQHYKNYWRGFSDFDGQSSRKDFWIPILINLLISVVLLIIMIVSFTALFIPFSGGIWFAGASLTALFVWCVIRIVPNAAVLVRRFHDVGLVGWLAVVLFICHFIPYVDIVADILIIIIACMNPNSANVQAFAWKKPGAEQETTVANDTNSATNKMSDDENSATRESSESQPNTDELKQKHYRQLSLNLNNTTESDDHNSKLSDTDDSKSDDSQN